MELREDIGEESTQVDGQGLLLIRDIGFDGSEREHAGHEFLHSLTVSLGSLNTGAVLGTGPIADSEDLQGGLDDGDSCLEFVGRVADKLTLLVEGTLEAGEGNLESQGKRGEFPDLKNLSRRLEIPGMNGDLASLTCKFAEWLKSSTKEFEHDEGAEREKR